MGVEDKLFTWESWDEIGSDMGCDIQFNQCTFVQDVGNFKKGDEVDCIYISYTEERMIVYQGDEETRFTIELLVFPES